MYIQCGDLTLKKHAVFGIQRVISAHARDPDPQIIDQLQQWLIETLQTETNEFLWRSLCEVAALMIKNWPDFNYDAMYQLANQLLSNPNQLAIGLCLWRKIFPQEKEGISERTINLTKELFVIASHSLLNENSLIRQSAFKLINALIWKLGNDVEKNEELMQILENVEITLTCYVEIIFKTNVITNELQNFITAYSDIFQGEVLYFFINSTSIIDTAIIAIADPEIPVDVRIFIHSLIHAGFIHYPRTDKSTFIILHYTVQLTLAACHENRQDATYTFAEDFFNLVVEFENEKDGIEAFVFLAEKIQQLSQSDDICNRQVALLLIKSTVSVMNIEMAKLFLNLSLRISDCGDEILVLACCMTISEFISNMNEVIILVFDQLSKFLLKYARLPAAMLDLCRAIKVIQQPPEFFKNIIELLLSNLPQANLSQAIEIFYCVKSCFSNMKYVSPFDQSLNCESIISILFSAVSLNEEYRTVVLESFGSIVPAAPLLIRQNLEAIVGLCNASMQNFLDPNFSASVTCIRKIVSYLPNSIAPFLPQVVPLMLEIITMKDPNIPEMDIEGVIDSFKKTKCDTMKCLCTIGSEINEFGDQYADLLWKCTNSQSRINEQIQPNMNPELAENQDSIDLVRQQNMIALMMQNQNELSMSSKILISGAKLFSKRNVDLKSILNQLIDNIQNCTDFDALVVFLHAMREWILFIPREIILDPALRNQIGNTLMFASTGIYTGFIDFLTIPKILRRALYGALIAFADTCRDILSDIAGEYYNIVKLEIANPDKLQCAQILHFLSKVFMYCRIEDDKLFEIISDKVFDTVHYYQLNYNSINYEILTSTFASLICLYRTKKEKIADKINEILAYINYFIQNPQIESPEFRLSYQTLYLSLFSIYQIEFNDEAKTIFNEIKIYKNSEYIPFLAECFIYGFKLIGDEMIPLLARFSTILFSSESWVLNIMMREDVLFYFNIINSIPREDLMTYCNFNESSFHQIVNNMQMCAA